MRLTQCLLVFVLVCELAIAQHMDVSEHKHQINGAEHPEQIPDSDAYRMFFLAAGTNPDAIVSSVGLTNSDKQSLEEVIQIFTDEYVILSEQIQSRRYRWNL